MFNCQSEHNSTVIIDDMYSRVTSQRFEFPHPNVVELKEKLMCLTYLELIKS